MSQIGSNNAFLTTREAANLLGVSLRTVQLWVENGRLEAWKTEGGHRRVSRVSVRRLLDVDLPANIEITKNTVNPERIKILVVEDDSILIKLYKTVIANWKMPLEVITAGNGTDALIRIGKDAPDLMITDLSMPNMDGIQLIRNLATSSFREGLEIVVVSGLDVAEIEARGGLPGDIRIFPKPVPFNELMMIVQGIVKRRDAYILPNQSQRG
jgi:excisionase family DNA binding protein